MARPQLGHNFGALLLALAIGLGLSMGPRAHGFRQDEVECEETYARLLECCDRSQLVYVDCEYHEGCETTTYPDLTPAEARCLRELSCSQIRAADLCTKLSERDEDTNMGGICP